VGLLDTTGRWRRFTSSLGGELLAWGLATSGLAYGVVLVLCQCEVVVMLRPSYGRNTKAATRRMQLKTVACGLQKRVERVAVM